MHGIAQPAQGVADRRSPALFAIPGREPYTARPPASRTGATPYCHASARRRVVSAWRFLLMAQGQGA
jgi:hypothetical protein